jgi:hypothetical protein
VNHSRFGEFAAWSAGLTPDYWPTLLDLHLLTSDL